MTSNRSDQVSDALYSLCKDIKKIIFKMSDAKKERTCVKFCKMDDFSKQLVSTLASSQNQRSLELENLIFEGIMKTLIDLSNKSSVFFM